MNVRKFRFPILIGVGVIGAGILLIQTHSRINSQQTQGAIGQRDVYRDAKVASADVSTPGSSPVSVKALMQTKEYKELAKNPAFQGLLASSAFQALANDTHVFSLMQNHQFLDLAQNHTFQVVMQSGQMSGLIALLTHQQSAAMDGSHQEMSESQQQLINNSAFQGLAHDDAFAALVSNMAESQALASLLASNSFAGLVNSSAFQGLLSESSFQAAMSNGSASSLLNQLQSGSVAQ